MSQCDVAFDLNICRPLWPSFSWSNNLLYILYSIQWINAILCDKESVWCDLWRKQCRSQWPILSWSSDFSFFLISWLVFNGWTSFYWKMSQCNTSFDLKINLGNSDLYFTFQWIYLSIEVKWFCFLLLFCSKKHLGFIGKARYRRATLSCDNSYSKACDFNCFDKQKIEFRNTVHIESAWSWLGVLGLEYDLFCLNLCFIITLNRIVTQNSKPSLHTYYYASRKQKDWFDDSDEESHAQHAQERPQFRR